MEINYHSCLTVPGFMRTLCYIKLGITSVISWRINFFTFLYITKSCRYGLQALITLLDPVECRLAEKWDKSCLCHFANSFQSSHWQDDRCRQQNLSYWHPTFIWLEMPWTLMFQFNLLNSCMASTIIFVPLWNILLIFAGWWQKR